jgi:hypothetical protein
MIRTDNYTALQHVVQDEWENRAQNNKAQEGLGISEKETMTSENICNFISVRAGPSTVNE